MQLQWVHNFLNLSMEHFYSQVTTSKSVKKHIDANPLSATNSHSTVSKLSLLFYLLHSGFGCQCSQARGKAMSCMIHLLINILLEIHHIRVLFVWLQFDKKIALWKILNPRQRREGPSYYYM